MPASTAEWRALRARIAAVAERPAADVRAFGDAELDGAFPAGGLALASWHEVVGEGLELETAAASAAFTCALARPLAERGAIVWIMRKEDLHAPGLASLGFPAERLIFVSTTSEAEARAALEDALATAGVAAAIGEVEDVDLTAGRRLQLACERRGATGFVIRRRPYGGTRPAVAGSAAASRWRIAAAPSDPAGEPGLGPARWRVALERCRGGRTGEWLMEACDGPQALRVVARLGDRQLATPADGWRRAG